MSDWVALRITAPLDLADAVANFLVERGASGVLTKEEGPHDAILEAALPEDGSAALGRWLASLAELEPRARAIRVATAPAPAVDWDRVWRRYHRPFAVGRRLLVAPPWDVPASPDRELLVIEPGMAFGTGQHATTRACLEAIDAFVAAGDPAKAVTSALDGGTGSGILAMALARLGVPRVVAVDVDPAVLPLARANLDRNGAGSVLLAGGAAAAVRGLFDLVVANLLVDAIVADASALRAAVAPHGRLVLSGLTARQLPRVAAAYADWTITETRAGDEWRTLTLERAR